MPRRTTTIGRGAFGRPISRDLHEWEVLHRIIDRRLPLTEDAVFILMRQILRRNNSVVLKSVKGSKAIPDYGNFVFSPDIDLLEVRQNGLIYGYELKGVRKSKQGHNPPPYYLGLDEALAYLINPVSSPMSRSTFTGSIFDYVYLVHPAQQINHSGIESFAQLINVCTPVGLVTVDYSGSKEIVKPKRNRYLKKDVKELFLRHLDKFRASFEYRLSLSQ